MTGCVLPIRLIVAGVVSHAISSVVITPVVVPIVVSLIFFALLISVPLIAIWAVVSTIFIIIRTIARIAVSAAALVSIVIGSIFRSPICPRITIISLISVGVAVRAAPVISRALPIYVSRSARSVSI